MSLTVLSVAYPLAPMGPDAAGGSEQILSLLDRTLARAGHHSIVVACEGSITEGTLVETPRPRGTLTPGVHSLAQRRHLEAIGRALQRWPVDLVHMHGLDFHQYLPPAGPPVLVTLHLPPDWYPPGVFELKRPQTFLHCVSETQQRGCPPHAKMLPVIENGVPVDRLKSGIPKERYALALGRICPEKGFHIALDAATRARIPAVVAGELFSYKAHKQYYREQIAPRLNGNGHRFVGPVGFTEKRRLLSAARCLLVPSLVPETSSLVTMEALACGTPVIAFPSGALAEIIRDGKTGFLVRDEIEMAKAIERVDEIDPVACRRAAQERFSADRMVQTYIDLYHRIVSRKVSIEPFCTIGKGAAHVNGRARAGASISSTR